MKRKIIALCLIVAMLGVAVIGSTLAYFTDTAEATNVFTVGKIDIDLIEEVDVLSSTGKSLAADKLEYDNTGATYKDIMPTNYLQKEVTIQNNDAPAYVRVLVVMNNYLELNNAIDEFYEGKEINGVTYVKDGSEIQAIYDKVFDGWNMLYTKNEGIRGTLNKTPDDNLLRVDTVTVIDEYTLAASGNWYENESVTSGTGKFSGHYSQIMNKYERAYAFYLYLDKGESYTLFNGLNCPAEFNELQAKFFEGLQINVYADAIQAESFENNAKGAFDALNAAHSIASLAGREQNGAIVGAGDVVQINTAADLQAALDAATGTTSIVLGDDIVGNVTATQKPDVKVIIDGNGKSFDGAITVDGKSARYETAALTIMNVNFKADENVPATNTAFINLGVSGDNNTRYTNNVTVSGCTFDAAAEISVAAIKSYTGGDLNLTVEDCEVSANVHSLLQVTNVEKNLVVSGCEVYSKNGINLNNTPTAVISDCTFDVRGYALRVGVNGPVGGAEKSFTLKNNTMKSACEASDDAVIVIRDNAAEATITLENTTLTGTRDILGGGSANIIK